MPIKLSSTNLDEILQALEKQLSVLKSAPVGLVICGGSALIARGFVNRLTDDVDIVALMNAEGVMAAPQPLPESLIQAGAAVARELEFAAAWTRSHDASEGIWRSLQKLLRKMGYDDVADRI